MRSRKRPCGGAWTSSRSSSPKFLPDPTTLSGLGAQNVNLGALLHHRGKHPGAEAAFGRARDIYEKLAALFPTVPRYRASLAETHSNLGGVLMAQGKLSAAEAALRQALSIR